MPLYLYDDARAAALEPFALTRPAGELRTGALLIRERWEYALGERTEAFIARPHLADFAEAGAPPAAREMIPAGSIIVNSRLAPALERASARAAAWMCDGRIAAVRLDRDLSPDECASGATDLESLAPANATAVELRGHWLDESWQLIAVLPAQLAEDIAELGLRMPHLRPEHAIIIGDGRVFIEHGVHIEPQVCFDTRPGPVLVRKGATIQSFSRITGPCVIGEGSMILGARVTTSSIGDHCRIGGEVSSTIVIGHSNKAHDGFLGHSCLGRWVNLGAGTTTSNLKNTYGRVSLRMADGDRQTGLQLLGTLFGDHAKTGIGLCLRTGSIVGAGANVFGSGMPPKRVAPFSWGESQPYETYALDRFLMVAERMMQRRDVVLSDGARRQLATAHGLASQEGGAGSARPAAEARA
ncbi:MAG: putative sugar nucleotidyl transferase [Gemmatimonadaceae bacterium]